jgi:uncharacterized protein with PQ loop repeat
MSKGLHHFHKRKRVYENLEQYPHPDKWKNLLDKMIYFVGIFGPLMTAPQLAKIFIEKSAEGLSLITWASYVVVAIFWVIYGIAHKEKPIIVIYFFWVVVNSLAVIGILLYGQ